MSDTPIYDATTPKPSTPPEVGEAPCDPDTRWQGRARPVPAPPGFRWLPPSLPAWARPEDDLTSLPRLVHPAPLDDEALSTKPA